MKQIELTRGYVATIDDEDYERVSTHSWYAKENVGKFSTVVYAISRIGGKLTRLHRFVLGLTDPSIFVDHRNHDGLDCQKHNLRIATALDNLGNQRKVRGHSKYKGVWWDKKARKWRAGIGGAKQRYLGLYRSEVDAALAYDAAAREHFGEFALTNFGEVCHL